MSVSIHFREDLGDRRAAERVLAGQPPRSFVTWRVGDSDSAFVLSYVSEAFGRPEHVDLRRGVDGSFRSAQGLDEGSYRTLTDFVATRRYLATEQVVRTATVTSGAAPDAAAPPIATDGVRRRAVPGIGGRAELPAELPLPQPKHRRLRAGSDGEEDQVDVVVPPTCPHGVQRFVFAAVGVLAIGVAVWAGVEYREHERECRSRWQRVCDSG